MIFAALDLETAPETGHPQTYALQPWRAREGKAKVTSIATALPNQKPAVFNPEKTSQVLNELLNPEIYAVTWNGLFDVAWLIASGHERAVTQIKWIDGMLLWKWLENCQYREMYGASWSLVAATEELLNPKQFTWVPAYLRLKADEPPAGEKDDYWQLRAQFDALATLHLANIIWHRLTPKQRNSALIEARCLVPTAQSWLRGIYLDDRLAAEMAPVMTQEMRDIEMRLGVYQEVKGQWVPSPILSSPKQLAETLYDKWGMTCTRFTAKGARSSDKAALTYLADYNDKVLEILRWRELNTQFTKFIKGIFKTKDYLGSSITHPQPKIFSTYTGRMTYATKSGGKGEAAKARVGVPVHQWPRPKALRTLVKAPPGKALVEFDASGQEMRFMACQSRDEAMIQIFNSKSPSDDIHSYMGAQLSGMRFDVFLKSKADGVPAVVGPTGYRYQGKFTNLSCIAAGTKVMTDDGYKPIEDITHRDKIFDGVEFVEHGDVIEKGVKDVIRRGHVAATADHRFLNASGRWVPWGIVDAKYDLAIADIGGQWGSTEVTSTTRANTYDIINCGPRNRFVVSGGLIAHNCQYRIGEKSLRIKSRVDYGMNKDILTIRSWKNTYLRTFSGIKRYWNSSINLARRNGFAESLAGRRYAITMWGEDYKWPSEQSAINFPIQSSGGDQKELGLAMLTARYPELEFAMDLHDGLYFYADINKHLPELIVAAKEDLNNMNYVDAWGWEPLVPLIWDASVGVNWGSKREL